MLSTVLIIDKRIELSTKYKKSIDDTEAETIIAHTLKEAMNIIQNLEPEMIIISDSIDEELSEFCQKVRTLTYNTRPIIIALSKSADISDRIKVLENGADDFLSEPVNIDEFKSRIKAHLRRDVESNLDNKTLLPNNKYVYRALKRVLKSENKAVLIIGFENLKDYETVYTEIAGDKIIQTFIAIAKSALEEQDFIGQLDEINFVIITNKYNLEKLAEFLTFAFDTVSPKFYSETDAHRGYMLIKGERYAGMRVNFVSILAGGISEGFNMFPKVELLIDKLREIKSTAKLPSGSNYAIERAKLTASDSVVLNNINKTIFIKEPDESLSYLIRTSLELQGYDVLDNLDINSSIQPSVVIADCGDNLSELEFVSGIKQSRNFVNTKFIVTTTVHDKSKILDSGADLYLPKPYEISDLIRWVEYFIK